MGKVWKVTRYDSAGKDVGTDYEVEISYAGHGSPVLIPEHDLEDLIEALNLALDFAKTRKDEYGSDVPCSPTEHATV